MYNIYVIQQGVRIQRVLCMHKNVECWVLFLFDGRGEIGSIYLWKFKICNRARNSAW